MIPRDEPYISCNEVTKFSNTWNVKRQCTISYCTHIRHLDGDHQMQSSSENNHFLAIGRPLVSGSFQRTVCLVARNKLRRNSSPGGTNKKSWLVHSCSACLRCQYRNDHTANMAVCVPRFQMAVCVLPALWSARLL